MIAETHLLSRMPGRLGALLTSSAGWTIDGAMDADCSPHVAAAQTLPSEAGQGLGLSCCRVPAKCQASQFEEKSTWRNLRQLKTVARVFVHVNSCHHFL